MNEYQDQDMWFELYGYDGFRWVFVGDFDTQREAEEYARNGGTVVAYKSYSIKRAYGLTD